MIIIETNLATNIPVQTSQVKSNLNWQQTVQIVPSELLKNPAHGEKMAREQSPQSTRPPLPSSQEIARN